MKRVLAALALLLAGALPAAAQPWDATRTVRLVVGYTPGGSFDVVARALADGLQARLGNPVVVENRPGAGGSIGSEFVARATPDGYTLLVGGAGTHGVTPAIRRNLPFDTARDFTAVARIAEFANVMVVNTSNPARDLRAFIDWAKAQRQGATFGSQGAGTSIHLTGEMFRLRTGLDMTHVPYRGAAQVHADMLAGRVDVMFDNLPSVMGQIEARAMRALAVTSARRVPGLPDVPTMAEAGMADFVVTSWVGVFGPARMDPTVVERLSRAVQAATEAPQGRERLLAMGAQLAPAGPTEFDAAWRADMRRWQEVVVAARVELLD
ncbi:Bug family tripartite tricarboxylate transporter substrate binding protein [Plastoroseomonas hellenica]|uniref:Bug family tripartite tricarboxylate transporter substrate binding protein n=1 Tax=Plastoroseomonas hellenica TaxID=2687306 RepID=UPI001BA66123|nr:tripartite tricarboxylate transporter substrate binding protein [Plastoroseomonas hellenica]MBR0641717.1 tripartite tricarboxylate transporter substrate binding protein [Plastoroseomonas hellenica]